MLHEAGAQLPGEFPRLQQALGKQGPSEGLRFRIMHPDPGTERLRSSCTEPAALRQDRQEQQDGVLLSPPWKVKVYVI